MRQHLTAVLAAAEVAQAEVRGASIGSGELTFTPGDVRPGEYSFDVGTAGSATLVFQTILPALMLAGGPSQLCLRGGTHNTYAPPFDFLQKAFLPLLARMGPQVDATLDRPGFYPAGGGQVTVAIRPAERQGDRGSRLSPIELLDRGPVVRRLARAIVSRLPRHIAQREVDTLRQRLDWPAECTAVEEVGSPGPGNVLIVELEMPARHRGLLGLRAAGCGRKRLPKAWRRRCNKYLDADVPVGPHLADQLLIPLALSGGGRFHTLAPSEHTRTNIDTLRQFLDVRISVKEIGSGVWEIAAGR